MTDYKLVPVLGDGLLPCPFCGQPPTEYDQIGYSSVKCHDCQFSIKRKSEDGPPYAPDLWNRRAAPAVQGEPVGHATGQFAAMVKGPLTFTVQAYGRLPETGAKLYLAPQPTEQQPAPAVQGESDHSRLRARFDEIEREICEGKHTASSVFTQMRTAALYTAPEPAEQQPAPDVAGLVEALEAARAMWGDYLPPGNSKAMVAMRLVDAALAAHRQQEPSHDNQ